MSSRLWRGPSSIRVCRRAFLAAAVLSVAPAPGFARDIAGFRSAPAGPGQGAAIILYSPGSAPEFIADRCTPDDREIPRVLRDLDGRKLRGVTLRVATVCTPTRVGRFVARTGRGLPKVVGRAEDLDRLIEAMHRRGVPASHLFLAGHSAGAWASLLAARARPSGVNAVVALSPAFAGPRRGRPAGWRRLRAVLARSLARAPTPALIFAFDGDRYEPPPDLEFLRRAPATRLVALPSRSIDGIACRPDVGDLPGSPHLTAFDDCFRRTQTGTILEFLAARLRAAGIVSKGEHDRASHRHSWKPARARPGS
jgi:pimeloyl-ACP methyl ester carboxylesterase